MWPWAGDQPPSLRPWAHMGDEAAERRWGVSCVSALLQVAASPATGPAALGSLRVLRAK